MATVMATTSHRYPACALITLLLVLFSGMLSTAAQADSSFDQGIKLLAEKSFKKKAEAVKLLASSQHEKSLEMLQAMSRGELFYHKKTKAIVYAAKVDGGYQIKDAISGEDLGKVGKRKVKKVSINNKLRSQLTQAMASKQLGAESPEVRQKALESMLSDITADSLPVLTGRQKLEEDKEVAEVLAVAIALAQLEDKDESVRVKALKKLDGSLYPAVRVKVTKLAEKDSSKAVKKAAADVLKTIESRVDLFGNLETLFFRYQSRIGTDPGSYRPCHHLWCYGRYQYGSR